jgi:hypothetical protein
MEIKVFDIICIKKHSIKSFVCTNLNRFRTIFKFNSVSHRYFIYFTSKVDIHLMVKKIT